jgi:hypothetical protein
MFDNAEKYLKGVLQTHFDPKKLPPIAKWKAEIEKQSAERSGLNQQYNTLKDEVKKAEQIRKSIYIIVRQEHGDHQQHKHRRIVNIYLLCHNLGN